MPPAGRFRTVRRSQKPRNGKRRPKKDEAAPAGHILSGCPPQPVGVGNGLSTALADKNGEIQTGLRDGDLRHTVAALYLAALAAPGSALSTPSARLGWRRVPFALALEMSALVAEELSFSLGVTPHGKAAVEIQAPPLTL